ncbi:MAG: hypothetical protein ACYC61_19870, partial [Isosphaeraceae bacterium]
MRDSRRTGTHKYGAVLVGAIAVVALGLAAMVARWRSLAADPEDFLPGKAASRLAGRPRSMGHPEPDDPTWAAVYGTAGPPFLPALAADPRLIPLRRAGETWRAAAG